MITYNHEQFIVQAIEGVLMQKTNFPIELIIGEDCSTDNTAAIIREYQQMYPDIIKARFNSPNLGVMPNAVKTLQECTGKYIALCEGDDYWTDQCKIQKQVDFLESNPDYSLCFHNALIKQESLKANDQFFCNEKVKETTTIQDVIKKYYIHTATMLFRRTALNIPVWLKDIYNGDYSLQLILAEKGKIKYLKEVMSVYRRSIVTGSLTSKYSTMNNLNSLINLFIVFNIHSQKKYSRLINIRLIRLKLEKFILSQKFNLPKIWTISKRFKALVISVTGKVESTY
jgi:glycosyltransferase involved in cell wall biosynthesis